MNKRPEEIQELFDEIESWSEEAINIDFGGLNVPYSGGLDELIGILSKRVESDSV